MRSIILFAAAVGLAAGAFAQTEQDHAAHHPDGPSAPAAAVKKAPAKAQAATKGKAKTAVPAASGGMGMGTGGGMDNMKEMHDQMHKPGGMHDQMHGRDAKMMGGGMTGTPPASATSK